MSVNLLWNLADLIIEIKILQEKILLWKSKLGKFVLLLDYRTRTVTHRDIIKFKMHLSYTI